MSFSSDDIRQRFIDYFAGHGHTHVASSSLVPADDPTLLFTNAGMNQFKATFLGESSRPYGRAVTSQKCMRVSGKHNDLETVGPSLYHHTFFEMLGNFSFGEYFKVEVIVMAWELMTEEFQLPKDRLWATVFEEDDEAEDLWVGETDIQPRHVLRLGKEDNYWSMGDTGPCGPCSELHYDYELDELGEPQGPVDLDSDRFVELWNLVFMQFNANADGSIEPLPSPNIDTGAGLERLTSVLQGTRSNYDTDLFRPIIDAVADKAGHAYGDAAESDVALRVIGDHSRALAFLLADGVMPANEGRGYVLRRLLRRAMRFGMKLGLDQPFLRTTALTVVDRMGTIYPELEEHSDLIARVVQSEEERFLQTLASGSQMFNELAAGLQAASESTIAGDDAFRLYDTFGLPIELTREFATAEGLTIDEDGFATALEAQRTRARSAWKGADDQPMRDLVRKLTAASAPTEFLAYVSTEVSEASVVLLLRDGESVDKLVAGDSAGVLIDRTPFYAESGGQVADVGELRWAGGSGSITDVQRPVTGTILHSVEVQEGELQLGQEVSLQVDVTRRQRIRRNHTATHLLHAALRKLLGEHVRQAGSLVDDDRLRFDFAHFEPVDSKCLENLEAEVNVAIRDDVALDIEEMDYDNAIERGALAFFGDKYGDRVRVVNIPGVSTELCGGTHVGRTGEIGAFVVQREESVGAGIRRIEAVTGELALRMLQHYRELVRDAAGRMRTPEDRLPDSVGRLVQRTQDAEREVERLSLKLASHEAGSDVDADVIEVEGVRVLRREVEGLEASGLRNLVDELKAKVGSGVVVVGMRSGGKASLVVGTTADLASRIAASDVIRAIAPIVGGGGGGHRELAQAGGPEAGKVTEALERTPKLIADLLQ